MKKFFILFLLTFVTLAACNNNDSATRVEMVTTEGTIILKLYDETPSHRDNFISLVNECRYDSLLFHRVIPGFMIQGGDPDSKYAPSGVMLGEGDLDYRLNTEIKPGLFHKRGALAAAREADDVNPAKMSSAMQFYIVCGKVYTPMELQKLQSIIEERTGRKMDMSNEQITAYTKDGGTPVLDGEYTVFGEVLSGMEVVERIQNVERDSLDRPLNDVRILSVKVKK